MCACECKRECVFLFSRTPITFETVGGGFGEGRERVNNKLPSYLTTGM